MGCDDPEEDEDSCDGDGSKKMKMVVILCVVAAALLCCCGIGVYCWKRSQKPVMELPVTASAASDLPLHSSDMQIASAMEVVRQPALLHRWRATRTQCKAKMLDLGDLMELMAEFAEEESYVAATNKPLSKFGLPRDSF